MFETPAPRAAGSRCLRPQELFLRALRATARIARVEGSLQLYGRCPSCRCPSCACHRGLRVTHRRPRERHSHWQNRRGRLRRLLRRGHTASVLQACRGCRARASMRSSAQRVRLRSGRAAGHLQRVGASAACPSLKELPYFMHCRVRSCTRERDTLARRLGRPPAGAFPDCPAHRRTSYFNVHNKVLRPDAS